MADINDLAQQIAYYQAGGSPPGRNTGELFNQGLSNALALGKGYEDIIKQRLEAKKLALGQTPYYKFDQSLPQDPNAVDQQQKASDAAQYGYKTAFQAQRDSAGTSNDPGAQPTPYANPYGAFEKDNGFNPRLPLDTIKEVAQAKALSDPGTILFTDKTGTRFGRFPSDETPYPYRVSKKQAVPTLAAQGRTDAANAPVAVETFGEAHGTKVPPKTKLYNDHSDENNQRRDDRVGQMVVNLRSKLESNPFLNGLRNSQVGLEQLDLTRKLASEGNTVVAAAMGAKAAHAMHEVGVLTNQDVTRYVTSGQLARGSADKLSRWMTGTPTNATLDEIKQMTEVLSDSYMNRVQSIYNDNANVLARNFNMTPEEAAYKLSIPYRAIEAQRAPQAPPPGGGGGTGWTADKQRRLDELKKKQAAGALK